MPKSTTSLIALSAGGADKELAPYGLGMEHIDELMVRVAKTLLAGGHRLSFGGTLGNAEQDLTRYLIEAAQNWLDDASAKKCDVTRPQTWPLVNYSAWPYYRFIDDEQRARLVGVCQFINIDPDGLPESELKRLADRMKYDAQAKISNADSLSKMREQATQDAHLRVVWAGKITGATGWMSGILEEVGCSLAQEKPVLILGGFGGCARLIADFLAEDSKSEFLPEPLILNIGTEYSHAKLLPDEARQALEQRFETITANLIDYRTRIWTSDKVNGLPSNTVRDALEADTGRRVTALVANAAAEIAKQ